MQNKAITSVITTTATPTATTTTTATSKIATKSRINSQSKTTIKNKDTNAKTSIRNRNKNTKTKTIGAVTTANIDLLDVLSVQSEPARERQLQQQQHQHQHQQQQQQQQQPFQPRQQRGEKPAPDWSRISICSSSSQDVPTDTESSDGSSASNCTCSYHTNQLQFVQNHNNHQDNQQKQQEQRQKDQIRAEQCLRMCRNDDIDIDIVIGDTSESHSFSDNKSKSEGEGELEGEGNGSNIIIRNELNKCTDIASNLINYNNHNNYINNYYSNTANKAIRVPNNNNNSNHNHNNNHHQANNKIENGNEDNKSGHVVVQLDSQAQLKATENHLQNHLTKNYQLEHDQFQVDSILSFKILDILQQHSHLNTLNDRLSKPKTYPNNTLIVDLNKCHQNISRFWPKPIQASAKITTPLGSKSFCPFLSSKNDTSQQKVKKSRYKFQMPDSLLSANPRLKPDEYDRALSVLTSDVRFKLHLLLYRRVQTIWLLLSTLSCVVIPLILANLESVLLLGACFVWLILQLFGALMSAKFRKKLDEMLEKAVAQVNTFFMDHNLIVGVINVGSFIFKAKLIIPMLYFDTSQCREQIESIISIDSLKDADENNKTSNSDSDSNNYYNYDNIRKQHILDYSKIDLHSMKLNVTALAQSQLAKKIILRYSQRWISFYENGKLMFTDDRSRPRHLSTGKCMCQFIEEHFKNSQLENEDYGLDG